MRDGGYLGNMLNTVLVANFKKTKSQTGVIFLVKGMTDREFYI